MSGRCEPPGGDGALDRLGEAEESLGIEAALDRPQALGVSAVIGGRPVIEIRIGEVRIDAAGCVSMRARPGPVKPLVPP